MRSIRTAVAVLATSALSLTSVVFNATVAQATMQNHVASGAALARTVSGNTYGFNEPLATVATSGYVWTVNYNGNTITQFSATDGSFVRTISGNTYKFNRLWDMTSDGTHLWVSNFSGNSVTEINMSDGSLVRVLESSTYQFNRPSGLISDGTHIWIANGGNNSVTEVNISDGSFVRNVSGAAYGFNQPIYPISDGTNLWVTNYAGKSVTEISLSTGALVRVLSAANYGFNNPRRPAFDGTNIWVPNADANSVTEFKVSDGSLVRVINNAAYGLNAPQMIVRENSRIWVTSYAGNTVTGINTADGSLYQQLSTGWNFNSPWGVAAEGSHVWVANRSTGSNSGSLTEICTNCTTPSTPTALSATSAAASAVLTWTAPADGGAAITGYTVTASPGGATCTATTTTCTVTGLTNGTAYSFTVTATNSLGTSSPSSSASTTPYGTPDVVGNLQQGGRDGRVELTWEAPTNTGGKPITSYSVWYSISPQTNYTKVTTNDLAYTINGLTNGTTYRILVFANNELGVGTASLVYGKPIQPPTAPLNLAATAGEGQVTLTWSAPSSIGGSSLRPYTITQTPGGTTYTAAVMPRSYTVTGLTNGTSYSFTIHANNIGGASPESNSASATPVRTSTAPSAPQSPIAAAGSRSATVSWTAPSSDGGSAIASYYVTSSPGSKHCTATAPATSCVVAGLTAGTNYTFSITATNTAGTSVASSATSSVKVLDDPSAPRNVTLTRAQFGLTKGRFVVSWTAPASDGGASIASYTVTLTPGNYTCTVNAPTTSCTMSGDGVNGLSYETQYTASVTANNGVADGSAATGTGTLSALPSVPSLGTPSFTYGPNYYGVQEATISIPVTCPTYWGSSVGTVFVTVTGSSSYPTNLSASLTKSGCGTTLTFPALPIYGRFTISAVATNTAGGSSTVTEASNADGPLPTPKVLVSYSPTSQNFNINVTSETDGNGFTFALSDQTSGQTICTKTTGSFLCTEKLTALSGLGTILQADLRLVVTSSANYSTQTYSYPVRLVRIACPVTNTNCTQIVGNFLQINRANLVDANLSSLDLSYSSITNSYFGGANLANASFDNALIQSTDMSNTKDNGAGVSMKGAVIINTNFLNAQLKANMVGASASSMTANFTPSNVNIAGGVIAKGVWLANGMSVFGKDLSGANLANVGELKNMTFVGVNLSNVSFENDNLTNSYIAKCNVTGANFAGTTLTGVSSTSNTGAMSSLSVGYRLVSGTIFGPGVVLIRKNLSGLDLSNLNLSGAVLINSDLTNVNFSNSNLTGVNVAQVSNGVASFNPGLLTGADFTGATMTNMWGISDSALYTSSSRYITVTGSAPRTLPRGVIFDATSSRLILP